MVLPFRDFVVVLRSDVLNVVLAFGRPSLFPACLFEFTLAAVSFLVSPLNFRFSLSHASPSSISALHFSI